MSNLGTKLKFTRIRAHIQTHTHTNKASKLHRPKDPMSSTGGNGNVAILWDIENCSVPVEVNAEDVAGNIRYALQDHPQIGAVTMFSAYGDFNHFPRKVREGCQRTGVNLIDVPNGKKDASDKAILVDMFLFALDNRPPSTIFLITGDVDFAPALHKLGQRGYMVVLVVPDGVGVSSALRAAGNYVWDWPSLCRGELVNSQKFVKNRSRFEDQNSLPGYQNAFPEEGSGQWAADEHDTQNDEEEIFTWRPPLNVYPVDSGVSYPTGEMGTLGDASDPTSPGGTSETMWVQPGDISGLKRQLVKLLNLNSGKIALVRVPAEYGKQFGRPLILAEYGSTRLVNLIDKMRDSLCIKGEGGQKILHLAKSSSRSSHKHSNSSNRGSVPKSEKEKDVSEDSEPEGQGPVVKELEKETNRFEKVTVEKVEDPVDNGKLATFRHDLQHLLVSWTWRIKFSDFLSLYKQRYTRDIDLKGFGVENLESLFQKVKDVAVIKEDPATKDAFVVGVNARI
ncbi:unnamed protein product [Sphagnum jensenii]|uniref:HTH OST-type domain-containing protein n=1 Tax=Sphagnum jensenii TaxID=128206 RepID=A0ABP1ADJ5_9BRYO